MHYPQADQNEPFHRKMMHMGQVPISPAMMQGPHHIQRETPEHYGRGLLHLLSQISKL